MSGSAVSSFAELRLVARLDMSGSVVSSFAGVVAKVAGMVTGVCLIVSAVGVDTGVLLGVRGTFFGVVGGLP